MGHKSNLATFTRPSNTTAYAPGDLVANSVTNTAVTALSLTWGGSISGSLRRLILRTSNATITNGNFHAWLFGADPSGAVTNGDNDPIAGLNLTTYKLITPAPINLYAAMTGVGGYGEATYDRDLIQLPQTVYALLEARAAYTPASAETFSMQAELWT